MKAKLFLLLLILGLESSFGLPLFFLYLSYSFIHKYSEKYLLLSVFVTSFLLAIFYSLSWPILAALLLFCFFIHKKIKEKIVWQLILFVLINAVIFILAELRFNYFYLFHLPVFMFYLYKANFKKYAA